MSAIQQALQAAVFSCCSGHGRAGSGVARLNRVTRFSGEGGKLQESTLRVSLTLRLRLH